MASRVSVVVAAAAATAATGAVIYPRLVAEAASADGAPQRIPVTDALAVKAVGLLGLSPEGIKHTQF